MREHLIDILSHTMPLGGINVIKVVGTEDATKIVAHTEGRTVVIQGSFKVAKPDMSGVYGLPNLAKLKTLLGFSEYASDAVVEVKRESKNNLVLPSAITFSNQGGDFTNEFRLMSKDLVDMQVNVPQYHPPVWQTQFVLQKSAVERFKKQYAASSESTTFTTKMEGQSLKVFIGQPSIQSGNFIMEANCSGYLSKPMTWPLKEFIAIINLPGEKTLKFSESMACEVSIETELLRYQYVIPTVKTVKPK